LAAVDYLHSPSRAQSSLASLDLVRLQCWCCCNCNCKLRDTSIPPAREEQQQIARRKQGLAVGPTSLTRGSYRRLYLSSPRPNRPVQLEMPLRQRQRRRRRLKRHLKIPAKTRSRNRVEKRCPLYLSPVLLHGLEDLTSIIPTWAFPPEAWGVSKGTAMTSGPEPRRPGPGPEARRWRQRHSTLASPVGPQSRGAAGAGDTRLPGAS
jgi:hypothetical protein